MKKILYIVSTLKRSGPTNQLYNLIKYIDQSRFELHLLTLSPEPEDSRSEDYRALGVHLHSMSLSRFTSFFFARRKLKKIIKQIKPSIIHTQGIRSDILVADLPLINITRVCTIHNIPQQDYAMRYSKFFAKIMLHKHMKALPKFNLCVGVSKSVSKNLQDFFGIENVTAIQNGIDTDIYYPGSLAEKAILREKLGLPVIGKIWISSGHLSHLKDPLFLINSWQHIIALDNNNHLVFIGNGKIENECRDAAAENTNIHILGRVTNVAEYLRASDYFISASKSEGLPNAVLEALASSLPILLSDINAHREIWEMSTNTGEIFTLDNLQNFTTALIKINKTNYSQMSVASTELVSQHLSAKKMSQRYQNIYKNALSIYKNK